MYPLAIIAGKIAAGVRSIREHAVGHHQFVAGLEGNVIYRIGKESNVTLGFTHPSYFTNWFVKRHDMSPRDFRKLGQRTKRSLGAPR